jgi:hypothetical protein
MIQRLQSERVQINVHVNTYYYINYQDYRSTLNTNYEQNV